VDEELSSLVKRSFDLISLPASQTQPEALEATTSNLSITEEERTVLAVSYKATTPRMLRVAVNGFFESLSLIVQVMEELDLDVLHETGHESLEGVQGIEQGMTGTATGVAG
jgi:EKC/KEOPS complex subunit PCC1/LAGE3